MAYRPNTSTDFWAKVQKTDTCWLWTGAPHNGYGRFRYQGRHWQAHVWAWTQVHGPVPAGLVLDHVLARGCTSRLCVRPAHLEPVTDAENFRRGTHAKREQTHCIHGHLFDDHNTYIKPNGTRMCRPCRAAAVRRLRGLRRSPP